MAGPARTSLLTGDAMARSRPLNVFHPDGEPRPDRRFEVLG